jgi:hypothetical protein
MAALLQGLYSIIGGVGESAVAANPIQESMQFHAHTQLLHQTDGLQTCRPATSPPELRTRPYHFSTTRWMSFADNIGE